MILLPLNNYGNRTISVDIGEDVYTFRTYYSAGEVDGWFMDISDASGAALVRGRAIVPGADNLLRGLGDAFEGQALLCVLLHGTERAAKNLGEGLFLLWIGAGEENPYKVADPMLYVGDYMHWIEEVSGEMKKNVEAD